MIVFITQEVVSEERVSEKGLKYDIEKAGLPKVQQPSTTFSNFQIEYE